MVKANSTKRIWDSKKKVYCNVGYLDMVKEFNESMGGVDLNEMLISLYIVDSQTRKRWYLTIIIHLVNIGNVNGWLPLRRYSGQLQVLKKNQHNLLQFMKGVADALLFAGKKLIRTTPGMPKKRTSSPHRYKWKKTMFQNLLLIFVITEFITDPNLVTNVTDAECVQ